MDVVETPIFHCTCMKKQAVSKKKAKGGVIENAIIAPVLCCGKRAKYEKNGTYYCETHAKSSGPDLVYPTKNISRSVLSKKSRDDLVILGQTYGVFPNLQIPDTNSASPAPFPPPPPPPPKTKKDCLAILVAFFLERCLVPLLEKKARGAGDTDLITIGRNMQVRLDELIDLQNITHVIMENQISPLANRMKTVQGMLTQYYIMKYPPHLIIEYISSANKLKDIVVRTTTDPLTNEAVPAVPAPASGTREKYKQNKSDGIQICARLLEQNAFLDPLQKWKNVMTDKSKRDDLADCFLQGIWYLKREKVIQPGNLIVY